MEINLNWDTIVSEALGAFLSGFILLAITLFIQNRTFKKQIELDELRHFQQTEFFINYIKSMNVNSFNHYILLNLLNYRTAKINFDEHFNYNTQFTNIFGKYFSWQKINEKHEYIFPPGARDDFYYVYYPYSRLNLTDKNMYIIFNTLKLNIVRDEQAILLNYMLDEIDNAKRDYSSKKIQKFLDLIRSLIAPKEHRYIPDNMGGSKFYTLIRDYQENNVPCFINTFCTELEEFNKKFSNIPISKLYTPVVLKINHEEFSLFLKSFNEHILTESKIIQENRTIFQKKYLIYSLKYEKISLKSKVKIIKKLIYITFEK